MGTRLPSNPNPTTEEDIKQHPLYPVRMLMVRDAVLLLAVLTIGIGLIFTLADQINQNSDAIFGFLASLPGRMSLLIIYGILPVFMAGQRSKRHILAAAAIFGLLLWYVDIISSPSGMNLFAPLASWQVFATPVVISAVLTVMRGAFVREEFNDIYLFLCILLVIAAYALDRHWAMIGIVFSFLFASGWFDKNKNHLGERPLVDLFGFGFYSCFIGGLYWWLAHTFSVNGYGDDLLLSLVPIPLGLMAFGAMIPRLRRERISKTNLIANSRIIGHP